MARLGAGGVDIDLFAYEDAQHGFDDRGLTMQIGVIGALSPRNCRVVESDGILTETTAGEPSTVDASCIERGATIGYSPEATFKAVRRCRPDH